MSTLPEPDAYDAMRDAIRDGLRPHPSHPGWFQPPIPRPPTVCEACGAYRDSDEADEPCSPREPDDDDLLRLYDVPTDTERHLAAWQMHQEAHR